MISPKAESRTHNDPAHPSLRVTMLPQTCLHAWENTGGQRHIEQAILLLLSSSNLLKSLPESLERLFTSLMAGYVGTSLAELLQLLGKAWTLELDGGSDNGKEVVMCHLVRGKTYDAEVGGEETSSFL